MQETTFQEAVHHGFYSVRLVLDSKNMETASKSPNSEMSNSISAAKYHLKPPGSLIRKPPGPAETGHLTPRSRTTSTSSTGIMSPLSETRPSSETRLGPIANMKAQGVSSLIFTLHNSQVIYIL